jgi:Mn2+/Fe2+ NRAMP family transporter
VLLPVSLVFLLLLANDRELMGRWANGPRLNVLTIAIVGFVSLSGAAYAVVSFLQVIHVL